MTRLAVALIAAAVALPGVACAEMQVQNTRYLCDRGVEIPVVYVNDPDQSLAVLQVEGSQILLYSDPMSAGGRYAWPSDGSSYVWVTEDAGATLFWRDGAAGTETVILTACVQS